MGASTDRHRRLANIYLVKTPLCPASYKYIAIHQREPRNVASLLPRVLLCQHRRNDSINIIRLTPHYFN